MATNASADKRWSSGLGFILATAGAAVGLGNLWRFPFLAGENGGGAFVLIYIACVFLIGMPIMLAELALGRTGGGSAMHSVRTLITQSGANRGWQFIGVLSIFIPFIGVAYYSVVGGWAVDYAAHGMIGKVASASGDLAGARFDTMLASPWRMLIAHSVFMGGIMLVLIRGVHGGIEAMSKVLMPLLFLLLTGLMVYALKVGDTARAMDFLFSPDWSAVTGKTIILAAGQAFFSLAIGVGVMITYGAYVPNTISLGRSVAIVALVDTAVALVAGIAIFPLVFAQGLDPAGGPGLIFVTLPTAFGQMSGGTVVGAAFFILLFFAAFTTGIGTLEPVVSWMEERRGMSRARGTLLAGFGAWFVGIAALLSFNIWSHIHPFNLVPGYDGKSIFDTMDFTIASVLLPFNGLLIALFTGWAVPRLVRGHLGLNPRVETLWIWVLRLLIPFAIILIAVWK